MARPKFIRIFLIFEVIKRLRRELSDKALLKRLQVIIYWVNQISSVIR